MDTTARHLRLLTDTIQRGGTHGSPTSPLLLATAQETRMSGSRRAKPGSALDPVHTAEAF